MNQLTVESRSYEHHETIEICSSYPEFVLTDVTKY